MGDEEDAVARRAAELRAEDAVAARSAAQADETLRAERLALVQRFRDTLTGKTAHGVECVASSGGPLGAIARFRFYKDGEIWTTDLFEFGIDQVEGDAGEPPFSYFLEPSGSAGTIRNPETGVAQALWGASEQAVIQFGVAIAIEMMARVIASGGQLGSGAELEAALNRHTRQKKQQAVRSREELLGGCLATIFSVFAFVVVVGLLLNLVKSCSGSG